MAREPFEPLPDNTPVVDSLMDVAFDLHNPYDDHEDTTPPAPRLLRRLKTRLAKRDHADA